VSYPPPLLVCASASMVASRMGPSCWTMPVFQVLWKGLQRPKMDWNHVLDSRSGRVHTVLSCWFRHAAIDESKASEGTNLLREHCKVYVIACDSL
jgi:hypothetical protein